MGEGLSREQGGDTGKAIGAGNGFGDAMLPHNSKKTDSEEIVK